MINEVISGSIGFDGLLMTDDLSMEALGGSIESRAAASLKAGCDMVLHCNGRMDEMVAIAGEVGALIGPAAARAARADAERMRARAAATPPSKDAAYRLETLLAGLGTV